ncbi:hypothetical protein [Variovorax sp. N23]|uniref:hypothetical protein n=1 Tax=Variovorax sp. N23 TaxID=2980555 RepID=UPI0021C7551C|nr:hypothetical protein [Variovorax sp. N23]MCU4118409.1 hypothetical protein [Variovorax sp. N23]
MKKTNRKSNAAQAQTRVNPALTSIVASVSQFCRRERVSAIALMGQGFSPALLPLFAALRQFERGEVELALSLLCDWEVDNNSVCDEPIFIPLVLEHNGGHALHVITNITDMAEEG